MNVRLLRRIQAAIKDEPRRFDMFSWVRTRLQDFGVANPPPCGTTACIAGFATILSHAKKGKAKLNGEFATTAQACQDASTNYQYEAVKALRITHRQGQRLFFVSNWPLKHSIEFQGAHTPAGRVKAACKRIDTFIKTGGRS